MIDTPITSFNFYFLIAVIQGLILSGIIIFQRPRRKMSTFLGLMILFFSLSLLHIILEESIHRFNVRFPLPMDFGLAFGPLAYFHVIYLKDPWRKFGIKESIHFLPSFLLDGVLFSSFFLYVGNNIEWANGNIENIQSASLIMALLSLIQLSFYAYSIHQEVKKIRSQTKEFNAIFSWVQKVLISWYIIIGFIVIAVPIALWNISSLDEKSYLLYKPMGVIIGLSIYGLGYLFLIKYRAQLNGFIERKIRIKFSSSEIEEKKEALIRSIRQNELFRDTDLSVAKLANHMNWPVNDISTVINESLSINFNDLINQFRVEAFQQLVQKPSSKKYSILGLAQEVGFSSKASFYRAFRKELNMTPSEYMKGLTQ